MANFGFEAGPWDNASKVDGAHVFSKKRKLLYGDEHDKAEYAEGAEHTYGKTELHKMHPIWRRNAMKHMSSLAARAKGAPVKIFKEPARR